METGGSNIQFAVNPEDGRMVVIEMNPRVSRSSALASKATGFPIAKIAAKLAVGYSLDELHNDITREDAGLLRADDRLRRHEDPTLHLREIPGADTTLTTADEVGGRSHGDRPHLQGVLAEGDCARSKSAHGLGRPREIRRTRSPTCRPFAGFRSRLRTCSFALRDAFLIGMTVEEIFDRQRSIRGSLRNSQAVAIGRRPAARARLQLDPLLRTAKQAGFSDARIAAPSDSNRQADARAAKGSGSARFQAASTPARPSSKPSRRTTTRPTRTEMKSTDDKKKIMILGGGPNRIGQGIEFDYCCVHASFALREAGYETIMVNSNPETVSTDYDTSDQLFFEPLTLEDVLEIYTQSGCDGVIVQFGGQTPLNLATELEAHGVNIIGTSPAMIDAAEDRDSIPRHPRPRRPKAARQPHRQIARARLRARRRDRLPDPAPPLLRAWWTRHVHRLRHERDEADRPRSV